MCAALLAACTSSGQTGVSDAPRAVDARVVIPDAAAAVLRATPSVQDFGNVVQGSLVAASVQVMNAGGTATGPLAVALTGAEANQFATDVGGCAGQSLAPADSCTTTVRFTPDAPGTKRATLLVTAEGGLVVSIELIGTSLVPGALMLMPAAADLGTVTVGASGTTKLTVKNTGGTTSGTISLDLGGTSKAELSLVDDGCTGKTIAGGGSCDVSVRLIPTVAGSKSASLAAMATPGGSTAAALSGLGQAEVKLTIDGTGGGTVTSTPAGLDCDEVCASASVTFTSSPVTLVATPKPGSTFGGFAGCDARPTATSCTLTLDAASKPVAATFVGNPDAGVPDAAPPDAPTPDAAPLMLRTWGGATASFRFIDAERLGPGTIGKLCIFGDDFDPRPYAVVATASHSPDDATWSVAATYGTSLPAGIALRVAYYRGAGLDNTPDGCVLQDSMGLRGGQFLTAAAFYTATLTRAPIPLVCEVSASDGCAYFPAITGTTATTGDCAAEGLYVLRDDTYTGVYRVVNLTLDAAAIGGSVAEGVSTPATNLSLVAEGHENDGQPVSASSTFRVCPAYVDSCYGADVTGGTLDVTACTKGDASWLLQELDEPRITMATKRTTLYILGLAAPPTTDAKMLDFTAYDGTTEIIVAHDVAE
jgi:hypothetical protein